jgi:hypothetical protein
LVEDTRLRDMLRAIGTPEPETLEPPPYSVEIEPDELAAAREELIGEALAGLTHNHAQALGERAGAAASAAAKRRRMIETRRSQRAKIKDLRGRLKRTRRRARTAQRRLESVKQSRWWRLRPRLPRRRS